MTTNGLEIGGHAIFNSHRHDSDRPHKRFGTNVQSKMKSRKKTPAAESVQRPVRDLSGLFPLSKALALMPCAQDDDVHRSLSTYAIVVHVAYRVVNVSVLAYFLVMTETSATLFTLLTLVTMMKFLCATVHVVVVLRKRKLLLKLTSDLDESAFYNNVYGKLAKLTILYEIYLYSAGQILQRRWLAAFRDIFSALDVLCPIFIILQYCTFLKIASQRLRETRLKLVVKFYRADEYLEEHLKTLKFIEGVNDVYTHQMFFCVVYLSFDFFVASYDSLERVLTGKNLEWLLCTVSYSILCISSVFQLCRACEIVKTKISRSAAVKENLSGSEGQLKVKDKLKVRERVKIKDTENNAKAKKFNLELYNIMMKNKDLCANDQLMLYVRAKFEITFTGSKIFFIGYPLLTSIIAATTTYLIILSQFGGREKKDA